jgi:Zn-dependent M28 family amino/carboxypeptidase
MHKRPASSFRIASLSLLVLAAGMAHGQEKPPAPLAGQGGTTSVKEVKPSWVAPAAGMQAEPGAGASAGASIGSSSGARVTPASAEVLGQYSQWWRAHNVTLAQPYFEGRAPGSDGNRRAADYLEFEFRRVGLEPAVPQDGVQSFRQPFQVGVTRTIKEQGLSYAKDGATTELKAGRDYNVLAFSGTGDVKAPLVFIGYGLTKGENGYTSFDEKDDLTGKIAVVFRFEPMNEQGKSLWSGEGWTQNAGLEPKIMAAIERHAAGVILVNPPGADDPRTGRLEDITSFRYGSDGTVPVVMMSIEAADALVRSADGAGRSLLDLRKLADQGRAVVELTSAEVSLKTSVTREPVMTDNVIGVLKGSGALAEEYLVIGAHYDHVGYGVFGSRDPQGNGKLHPGADDNASGTAAMMILARQIKADYDAMPAGTPRRSVLFMGFSAEESGLNGSRYYCQNPVVAKEKHSLMINLDMVGRLREGRLEVGGVGTADGFEAWLKPYWDGSGLNVAAKKGGSGPSDHASFNAAGIPVLFFFTGLHDQYHMPTDTWDTVNPEGAAQVVDLVHRLSLDFVQRPENLKYSDTSGQPGGAEGPAVAAGPRSRVRFGIAPGDYSGDVKGVLIGEATEGGSAAEAGLKAGDLMTAWNGKPLTNVESWMPLLADHKPGDTVEITYIRAGVEAKTTATLKARRGGQ